MNAPVLFPERRAGQKRFRAFRMERDAAPLSRGTVVSMRRASRAQHAPLRENPVQRHPSLHADDRRGLPAMVPPKPSEMPILSQESIFSRPGQGGVRKPWPPPPRRGPLSSSHAGVRRPACASSHRCGPSRRAKGFFIFFQEAQARRHPPQGRQTRALLLSEEQKSVFPPDERAAHFFKKTY